MLPYCAKPGLTLTLEPQGLRYVRQLHPTLILKILAYLHDAGHAAQHDFDRCATGESQILTAWPGIGQIRVLRELSLSGRYSPFSSK